MRGAALIAGLLALALLAAPPAGAVQPRASLPDIEQQVMCPTCGIPLAEANSVQADRERAFIRGLIAKGEDTAQIKRELVNQFGPAVLAMPQSSGFDLTAYLVPILVVLLTAVGLVLALPRWRRRGTASHAPGPELRAEDAARLDADLERYG